MDKGKEVVPVRGQPQAQKSVGPQSPVNREKLTGDSVRERGLKVGMTLGIVLAVVLASGMSALFMHTGWRIFTRQQIELFSGRINQEIIEGVSKEAESIFVDAVRAQNEILILLEQDVVQLSAIDEIRALYLVKLASQPGFTWVSLGLPNGNFYGARRLDTGNYQWVESIYDSQAGEAQRNITEYTLASGEFNIVNRTTVVNSYYAPQRSWYRLADQSDGRENIWTNVYVFSTSKRPGVNSAVAYRKDGEVQAVISIAIELTSLSSYIGSIQVSENGIAYIVNINEELIAYEDANQVVSTVQSEGSVVTKENLEYLQDECDCDLLEISGASVTSGLTAELRTVDLSSDPRLRILDNAIRGNDIFMSSLEDVQRATIRLEGTQDDFVIVMRPITDAIISESTYSTDTTLASLGVDSLGWFVGTSVPIEDITGDINRQARTLLFIVYSIILVNIAILIVVVRLWFVRPIRQIAKQAELIRDFNLESVHLPKSFIREVSLLTRSITSMNTGLSSFQKYVPTTLVKRLIERGLVAKLGGVESNVTIFFCDIARFTHISEIMREGIIEHLDSYFTHLSEIIQNTGGTIDKYIGDAIMAFWGAPISQKDHAALACQAALRCNTTLERLRVDWKSRGKEQLFVRFGLNSGKVLVGNFGSHFRMSYTAIGDPVNVASRLEGLNKIYGTSILIGERTYELVKNKFVTRRIDRVAVYGRSESIEVYELVAIKDNNYNPEDYEWVNVFEKGLWLYRNQEWKEATKYFLETHELVSKGDNASLLFIKRCKHLAQREVPQAWDGTFVLQTK